MSTPTLQNWKERLRELYLSEDPDEDGYHTKSILFNWGKFVFTRDENWKNKIKYYLATQHSIEEFIEQILALQRTELKEKIEGLPISISGMVIKDGKSQKQQDYISKDQVLSLLDTTEEE